MTDNRTTELLPCPFCGGEADVIDYNDECWVAHQCANGTSVETNSYETEAEAIAAWNSRAPIEYEGWFYLPKPKEGIVDYGEPAITRTENGYKVRQIVDVVDEAARKWGDDLGEYIMRRICEIWNSRADYHGYEQAAIEAWKNIKAWNSRAERTCECIAEYAKSPIDGKTIVLHRCSSCHELMRPHMNYCPNCGCKVVGE